MIISILAAIIRRILKLIATPFLLLWAVVSWVFVLLITPIVLVIEFIKSFIRGDWK